MREELIKQYFEVSVAVQRAWKSRVLAAFEDEDISVAQMGIMFIMSEKQSVISRDLAEHLRVTRSAIAQLIDGLAELGYVQRAEDSKDRRIMHISLSIKGKNALGRLEKRRRMIFDELVCDLNDDDLRSGIAIHEAMLKRL